MTIRTGLLAATGAALLLASCGGNDNESREQQMEAIAKEHGVDADVSLDAEGDVKSVTINNANGAQIGDNLQLPDGFPDDVPMAPDWVIMATSPTPGGFIVQAVTKASTSDALAAAREQLKANGWTETDFVHPGAMMAQVRFAKDNRITNFNLTDTGTSRTVQLVTMQNPK